MAVESSKLKTSLLLGMSFKVESNLSNWGGEWTWQGCVFSIELVGWIPSHRTRLIRGQQRMRTINSTQRSLIVLKFGWNVLLAV